MKKKKILLLTSIASVATFSAAAILFSSRSSVGTKADPEFTSYVIEFDGNHCFPDSEDTSYRQFTLAKTKGIGNTYDIESVDSYVYADNAEGISFPSGDILEIENPGEAYLSIKFSFVERANFDDENSYVDMYVGETYVVNNEFYYIATSDGRNYYQFWWYTGMTSETVVVEKVHLEFTCPK